MKTSDVFPGRFLRADDLSADTVVTVERVVMEELDTESGKAKKPVLYAREIKKPVVLNKTMWMVIARLHGDESDGWKGRPIVLTRVMTRAFGQDWPVIRVVPQRPATAGSAASAKIAPGSWREVRIHFGKCEGMKLGEFSQERLSWWQREWHPQRDNPQNRALRQALDESMTEQGSLALPGDDDDVATP